MPAHRVPCTPAEFAALLRAHGTVDAVQRVTGYGNDALYRLLAEAEAAGYTLPARAAHRPRIGVGAADARAALERHDGDKAQAAADLGVSVPTLNRRLREPPAAGGDVRASSPTPNAPPRADHADRPDHA